MLMAWLKLNQRGDLNAGTRHRSFDLELGNEKIDIYLLMFYVWRVKGMAYQIQIDIPIK